MTTDTRSFLEQAKADDLDPLVAAYQLATSIKNLPNFNIPGLKDRIVNLTEAQIKELVEMAESKTKE